MKKTLVKIVSILFPLVSAGVLWLVSSIFAWHHNIIGTVLAVALGAYMVAASRQLGYIPARQMSLGSLLITSLGVLLVIVSAWNHWWVILIAYVVAMFVVILIALIRFNKVKSIPETE